MDLGIGGAFLAGGLIIVAASYLHRVFNKQMFRDVPMPPIPSLIWGHLKKIHFTPVGIHYDQWFDKYGPTIQIRGAFGSEYMLASADPALIHHILTTNCYSYSKSGFIRPIVRRLVGEGLIWAEGTFHKQQRKQLVGAFSPDTVNKMAPAIFGVANRAVEHIFRLLSQGDPTVNIQDMASRTVLDILGSAVLGHDFNSLGGGASDIRQAWKNQGNIHLTFAGFWPTAVLRAFPWLGNLPLPSVLAQKYLKIVIDPLAKQLVVNGRKLAASELDNNSLFKTLGRTGELEHATLVSNISTFIIAGYDSTSAILTWALYSLAKNTVAQNKLRTELENLGREPTVKDLTTMDKLPYLDAVCKETFRMFPPSDMERVALKSDVIPLRFPIITPSGEKVQEIHVLKGDTIIISLVCSNRLDSVWGDGSVWRPERWFEPLPQRDQLTSGWSSLSTFGEGPRLCIGYRLALLEFKIVLSTLIRNFEFSLPKEDFMVDGRYFASMIPVVVGEEERGGYMPLRITPYHG